MRFFDTKDGQQDFEPALCTRGTCNIVGTALAIGLGVASAASSVAGGLISKSGADHAADATLEAARMSTAENRRQFDTTQKNLAPWTGAGAAAEGRLSYLLGLSPYIGDTTRSFNQNYGQMGSAPATLPGAPTSTNRPGYLQRVGAGMNFTDPSNRGGDSRVGEIRGPAPMQGGITDPAKFGSDPATQAALAPVSGTNDAANGDGFGSLMKDFTGKDLATDPGYLWRVSEGQKALERSGAAQGVLGSGKFLKDLTNFNQGSASQEFDAAFNRDLSRRTTKYNFLSGMSGGGQQNAQFVGGLGAQYAGINSGIMQSAANNAAQIRASGYGDLASAFAGAIPTGIYAAKYGRG